MDAQKQVLDLIKYHLDQVKLHQEKADLLKQYIGEMPVKPYDLRTIEKNEIVEETQFAYNMDIANATTKRKAALILFQKFPAIRTMREWQALYNEVTNTGISDDVTMTIRLLKMDKLAAKKDYGKNVVKWGSVDWWDREADDFKPEYKKAPEGALQFS